MPAATLRRDDASLQVFDRGTGPAVVFQHGLGGDEAQVAQVFPDDAGWRRLTVECRGHGGSTLGGTRPFGFAMFADDVLAAADDAGLDRFAVGGISMGAAIALRLAVRHPGPDRRPRPGAPRLGLRRRRRDNLRPIREAAELIRAHPLPEARRRFAASPTAARLAEEAPDNLASLLGYFERPDARGFADVLAAIAADGPGVSQAQAAALTVPTLVVGNARDARASARHRPRPRRRHPRRPLPRGGAQGRRQGAQRGGNPRRRSTASCAASSATGASRHHDHLVPGGPRRHRRPAPRPPARGVLALVGRPRQHGERAPAHRALRRPAPHRRRRRRLRPVVPVLPRPRRPHRAADAAADPRAPDGRGARSSRRRPASSSRPAPTSSASTPRTARPACAPPQLAQSLGAAAGVVLRLETPVAAIAPFLEHVAFVTLLGTAIGVKGQGLSEHACDRLAEARRLLKQSRA